MKSKMILLLLLGAAAASALFLWRKDREVQSPIARITRDGVLLEEIALDKVEQPYTLDVTDRSGSNTLLVERGRIRVSEADCSDQICIKQGFIGDSTVPIVCLPHKLMIEIIDGGGGLDGGTG